DSVRTFRVGASGSGLIGRWWYRHSSGAIAFEDYRPDSTWRLWIPGKIDTLGYRIALDTLYIKQSGKEGPWHWSVTDQRLALKPLMRNDNPLVLEREPQQ